MSNTKLQDQPMDSMVSSSSDTGIGDSLCSSINSNYPNNEQWIQLNTKLDNLEKIVQDVLKLVQAKEKKSPPKKLVKRPPSAKHSGRKPSASDVSKLYQFPNALQENITEFTAHIDPLVDTELVDTLVERDCLNEDDREAITAKKVASDAVRLLILKIKERGYTVIETFLDILIESGEYNWLGLKVKQSAEALASKHTQGPHCIVCFMKDMVNIKDIVDILWKNDIISSEMHGRIAESESVYKYRFKFWREVLFSINEEEEDNRDSVLKTLYRALELKYGYIVQYLKKVNTGRGPFDCCCARRRNYRPKLENSFYRSDDEYSTTSKSNLPSRDVLYGSPDNDSQTDFSSMDTSASNVAETQSFEKLERFSSIGSNHMNDSINDVRYRHKSGDFIPNELHTDPRTAEPTNTPFLFNVTPDGASDNRLSYSRSTSNMTVQATNLSSPGETGDTTNQRSSTSDAVVSPDSTVPQPKFIAKPSATQSQGESCHNQAENTPPNVNRANSVEHEGMLADTEDDEQEQPKTKRVSNKTRCRRYRDIPVFLDATVTPSRKITDNAAKKVSVQYSFSRKSKRSKKRQLRRQKSHQESDDTGDIPTTPEPTEDPGLKKPWNPLRNKIPTPKLTPKWDHNQVLRERKMTSHLAVPSQLYDEHGLAKCKSDTDFRTEESETVVSSECNYTM